MLEAVFQGILVNRGHKRDCLFLDQYIFLKSQCQFRSIDPNKLPLINVSSVANPTYHPSLLKQVLRCIANSVWLKSEWALTWSCVTKELNKCLWFPRCGWVFGTEWDLWAHLREHSGIFPVLLQARLPAAHWCPHLCWSVTYQHSFPTHCCLPPNSSHLNRLIYQHVAETKKSHEYVISLSHCMCVCLCACIFSTLTYGDDLRAHFGGLMKWESQTQLRICYTAGMRISKKDVYLLCVCVCAYVCLPRHWWM